MRTVQKRVFKAQRLIGLLGLLGLSLLALSGASTWAQGTPQTTPPPPIEDFFRLPQYFGGELSPDGQWLAVVASPEGRRTQLVVVNLRDPKEARALVTMDDSDIHHVQWVNNKRLVFDIAQLQEATDKPTARGLWAVDRDGGDFRQLVNARSSVPNTNMEGSSRLANSRIKERSETLLPWTWHLQDVVRDGSATSSCARTTTTETVNSARPPWPASTPIARKNSRWWRTHRPMSITG